MFVQVLVIKGWVSEILEMSCGAQGYFFCLPLGTGPGVSSGQKCRGQRDPRGPMVPWMVCTIPNPGRGQNTGRPLSHRLAGGAHSQKPLVTLWDRQGSWERLGGCTAMVLGLGCQERARKQGDGALILTWVTETARWLTEGSAEKSVCVSRA